MSHFFLKLKLAQKREQRGVSIKEVSKRVSLKAMRPRVLISKIAQIFQKARPRGPKTPFLLNQTYLTKLNKTVPS